MAQHPKGYLKATVRMGERVAALRRQNGWTQDDLAKKTGISRNQIQNIERARGNQFDPRTGEPTPSNPTLETIFRLAEAFAVDAHDLIENRPSGRRRL